MLVLVTNGEMFPGRNNVVKDLLKLNSNITNTKGSEYYEKA